MSVGGVAQPRMEANPNPQAHVMPSPSQPPQQPQPGFNQFTNWSMGFGRIPQQPSFFNPYMGNYNPYPQGGGMMYGDMMYRGPGATGGGPMGGGMGGFGTTFGGYGMGGGGYDMGYGGSPLLPPPQPTVNDLFSQYFSQQYYGGPAFNPFAATSFFGGGYGGGFGFGGGGEIGRAHV